jgi:hypothetical protein
MGARFPFLAVRRGFTCLLVRMRNAQRIRSNQVLALITIDWVKIEDALVLTAKEPCAKVINFAWFCI